VVIRQLKLADYRNYPCVSFSPSEGITVFHGANGAGKTNLLEAIHLCCLGRSHRTSQDRELIRQGSLSGSVQVQVMRRDGRREVKVMLWTQQKRAKQIFINGKPAARIGELMGNVNCVMFSPEDLELIKEGPALRRRFMDMQLSQLRPSYFFALQKYVSTLNQRNALLRAMAAPGSNKNSAGQLEVWDEQLAREGASITEHRRWFAEVLKIEAGKNYEHISGSKEEIFEARYMGVLSGADKLYENMLEGLYKTRREDMRRCVTHFGPHRDDLHLTIKGQDMKNFASQGQMRTAALAMRLSQLTMMKMETGEAPVLLLDDVMSELDPKRRALLLERIDGVQTFVTCTDRSDLSGAKAQAEVEVQLDKETGCAVLMDEKI
jgi:DNA replication and repair protein RecF